jgi:hypothetical protein
LWSDAVHRAQRRRDRRGELVELRVEQVDLLVELLPTPPEAAQREPSGLERVFGKRWWKRATVATIVVVG